MKKKEKRFKLLKSEMARRGHYFWPYRNKSGDKRTEASISALLSWASQTLERPTLSFEADVVTKVLRVSRVWEEWLTGQTELAGVFHLSHLAVFKKNLNKLMIYKNQEISHLKFYDFYAKIWRFSCLHFGMTM